MRCSGCGSKDIFWVNPNYPEVLCEECWKMRLQDQAHFREIVLDNYYDAMPY